MEAAVMGVASRRRLAAEEATVVVAGEVAPLHPLLAVMEAAVPLLLHPPTVEGVAGALVLLLHRLLVAATVVGAVPLHSRPPVIMPPPVVTVEVGEPLLQGSRAGVAEASVATTMAEAGVVAPPLLHPRAAVTEAVAIPPVHSLQTVAVMMAVAAAVAPWVAP